MATKVSRRLLAVWRCEHIFFPHVDVISGRRNKIIVLQDAAGN